MSMQRLPALLLLTLLGACAAVDASAPKLAAIKTIGIISAVGDELTVTKAGLTGLGGNAQSISIGSWGAMISSRVASARC
jgi:hypothetical protein